MEMAEERALREAFNHILAELGIFNIQISVREANLDRLAKAHDSIHELMYLAPLCLSSRASWHRRSAFLTYHFEAFFAAHRALIEALAGYYNAAYTLLRNTLELLIRGAFWECTAHKRFRENAGVLRKKAKKMKINGREVSILDFFNDAFKLKPEKEEELEAVSGGIFDMLAPIFEDKELRRLIPDLRTIVEQLESWGILHPIPNPVETIYEGIYGELSKDVHVIPDRTDIGRRLLRGENLFETVVIPEELDKFLELLREVMDVGVVVELNILSEWIELDGEVRARLRERLPVLKNLELSYGYQCLEGHLKGGRNQRAGKRAPQTPSYSVPVARR
jgi:hypothetical protein